MPRNMGRASQEPQGRTDYGVNFIVLTRGLDDRAETATKSGAERGCTHLSLRTRGWSILL